MYSALYNSARVTVTTMAFAVVFFLTPRAWVQNPTAPTTSQVPVNTLEQSDSCLWCTPAPPTSPCEADGDGLWLNPDAPRTEECPEQRASGDNGPNA